MGKRAQSGLQKLWAHLALRPTVVPHLREVMSASFPSGHALTSAVGVMERETADMGVLISLEDATAPMRKEAATAGFYTSPWGTHARVQLMTSEDLLTGRAIDRPPIQTSVTFKRAPKAVPQVRERRRLDFESPEPDQLL